MSQPSPTELSLRHLPDLSESSFQIPLADSSFLLSDDDDDADADFFQGADDSLGTPVPPRIIHEPLTLSQLTPKPAATTTADDALPAPFLAATSPPKTPVPDADGKPITDDRGTDGRSRVRSTLKLAIAPVGRPSGRFDVLKKEVETLISDSENVRPVSTLPLRGRSRPRGKPVRLS
jgi:hypothetical protein